MTTKVMLGTIAMTIIGLGMLYATGADNSQLGAESGSPEISLIRSGDETLRADAASGRLILRIPSADASNAQGEPESETSQPPAEPSNSPSSESADPPEFFGEPIGGNTVFVLDVSISMGIKDVGGGEDYDGNAVGNMSRLQAVKYETVKMLQGFSKDDRFDFILLAGAEKCHNPDRKQIKPVTDAWKSSFVEATDEQIAAAIEYVKGLKVWLGTPIYAALKRACTQYGTDVDRLVFLTDGAPWPRDAYGGDHRQAIFDEFGGWYAPLKSKGCKLVCVHIGQSDKAGTFMQDFSSGFGGRYIHR